MFQCYAEEWGIDERERLSRSSMIEILKVCVAVRRTSIQGLDYFIADGREVMHFTVRAGNCG
jgi:hypothetical protein